MGYFSWLTCDTERSISNRDSDRGTFPVYVLIPKEFGGGHIEETDYDGYGRFGGQDIYSLVARWNAPDKCNGNDDNDRLVGIDIACEDSQNESLRYPIKIAENPDAVYEYQSYSCNCPAQGYFYYDDEEELDE